MAKAKEKGITHKNIVIDLSTNIEQDLHEYVSIESIKKWIKENYELNGTYADIHVDDLLKFIDEP